MSRMRYGTYSWNAGRLEGEEQVKFIAAAALDFQRDDEYQDIRFYERYDFETGNVTFHDWHVHEMWKIRPEAYHKLITQRQRQMKAAEAEHDENN